MTEKQISELDHLLGLSLKAVRLGREVLMGYFGQLKHIEKKVKAGLVSEADKETEKVMQSFLKAVTPGFAFLGEESAHLLESSGSSGGNEKKSETQKFRGRWILDPLDGTTNFIHQFPIFCISLGLELDGEMVLGVIDVPYLEETYVARKGMGAYMNGRRLSVSQTPELEDALLATGFFNEEEKPLAEQLTIFSDLVRKSRAIRRPGAAAYDMCMVAQGVFDGFWEKGLKPWDSAAGTVLVREAGGIVINYLGKPYSPFDPDMIAGNAEIAGAILKSVEKNLVV